jgi:hypothetical protein
VPPSTCALQVMQTFTPGRSALSMVTLVASRHNPPIAAFCARLSARLSAAGKPKKVALTACMQQLLTILNAIVRQGVPWSTQTALDTQDNCFSVRMTVEQAYYYRDGGTANAFFGVNRRAACASPDVSASVGQV